LSRWRRCFPLEASTGLAPASAAKDAFASHPAGIAAGDEQLSTADRSHAALLEQIGRQLGHQLGERALGLCDLRR
jgi:hypothetical protein